MLLLRYQYGHQAHIDDPIIVSLDLNDNLRIDGIPIQVFVEIRLLGRLVLE